MGLCGDPRVVREKSLKKSWCPGMDLNHHPNARAVGA